MYTDGVCVLAGKDGNPTAAVRSDEPAAFEHSSRAQSLCQKSVFTAKQTPPVSRGLNDTNQCKQSYSSGCTNKSSRSICTGEIESMFLNLGLNQVPSAFRAFFLKRHFLRRSFFNSRHRSALCVTGTHTARGARAGVEERQPRTWARSREASSCFAVSSKPEPLLTFPARCVCLFVQLCRRAHVFKCEIEQQRDVG